MRKIWINARSLRHSTTDAGRRLWRFLRGRQLYDHKFRRQYPIAGYVADFACVEALLAIELDGGQHLECIAEDDMRTKKIEVNGYRVLRFWNDDVLLRTEAVLEEICRHLLPLPNPPLRAGEGANGI